MENKNMENYFITTAIIQNKDKFLIAKRAATKKFAPNQWEFISGFIDVSENAEETILREIEEELGVEGRIISTSNPFDIIDNEGKWRIIPFLVEIDTQDIQANPEDHSEIKWVTANKLSDYPDLKLFLNNEGVQKFLRIEK